ncbi:hypothetical protein ACWGDX_03125 [Streptomyces sp. NPDC055025]
MPDLWMPGATRLDIGDHAPTDGGPAKAIGHITWDENATAAKPKALVPYERLRDYFGKNSAGRAVAPHVLWDPFTGRVTQFLPATSRSKSLADKAGGTRTNRAGSVVIQVEALFFPYCVVGGKAYARLADTPCKGWAELNAWVRSWGVPDAWPNGAPTAKSNRNAANWAARPGWYAHADVPENDHADPLSWPAFTTREDIVTEEQMDQIADKVVDRILSKDVFTAPKDAADYEPTGPRSTWSGRAVFNDLVTRVRRISADTAAIRRKLDA